MAEPIKLPFGGWFMWAEGSMYLMNPFAAVMVTRRRFGLSLKFFDRLLLILFLNY